MAALIAAYPAHAGGRRIPYQGQLQGVSGDVSVSIELKDAPTGGVTVWGPEVHRVTLDAEGRFFVSIGSGQRDACRRVANLVANPGAEEPLVGGELPGWSEVVGAAWTSSSATTFTGTYAITPGSSGAIGEITELVQNVEVSALAQTIDAGTQRLRFTSRAHRLASETSQTLVEYLGASSQVLAAFDSGALPTAQTWIQLADERVAPIGTRSVRIHLLASRSAGTVTDAYWDDVRLAALPDVICDHRDGVPDLDQVDPHALYTEITIDDGTTQTVLFPRHRFEPAYRASSASDDVAVGTVVMWWGQLANVPADWELCDGGLATTPGATLIRPKPDLRGRFARVAAGAVLDPTLAPVLAGSDTIGTTSGGTTLSKAQMPNHFLPDTFTVTNTTGSHNHLINHVCTGNEEQSGTENHYTIGDGNGEVACPLTINTVPTHSHSLTSSLPSVGGSGQAHSHSVPARENRPAYLELFYIVRVK